jgi:IS30 family transposase
MEYKHLTEEERYQIDDLKREGFSQNKIAKLLSRSPSTLSREMNRNKGERGWRPRQAHCKAMERLSVRGASNVKKINKASWNYAEKHLTEDQWSPEQISGRAKLEGLPSISHETIYQRVLRDKHLGGSLYSHLRCKKSVKNVMGRPGQPEGVSLIE